MTWDENVQCFGKESSVRSAACRVGGSRANNGWETSPGLREHGAPWFLVSQVLYRDCEVAPQMNDIMSRYDVDEIDDGPYSDELHTAISRNLPAS